MFATHDGFHTCIVDRPSFVGVGFGRKRGVGNEIGTIICVQLSRYRACVIDQDLPTDVLVKPAWYGRRGWAALRRVLAAAGIAVCREYPMRW